MTPQDFLMNRSAGLGRKNKQTDMRETKLNRPVRGLVPGLELQIPLDIPDQQRRPRIKPRPVRAAVYFDGDSWKPPIVRPRSNNT